MARTSSIGPVRRPRRNTKSSRATSVSSSDAGAHDGSDSDWSPTSPASSRTSAAASVTHVEAPRFDDKQIDAGVQEFKEEYFGETEERFKMAFAVRWLSLSYAARDDKNVARVPLYNCFTHACKKYGIPEINAASFGKAIRGVFPNIGVRRFGGRKLSRYHYCGIWPTTEAERAVLEHFEEIDAAQVLATKGTSKTGSDEDAKESSGDSEDDASPVRRCATIPPPLRVLSQVSQKTSPAGSPAPPVQPQQIPIPGFPTLPEPYSQDAVAQEVWLAFEQHSAALFAVAKTLRFDLAQAAICDFYTHQEAWMRLLLEEPVLAALIVRGTALTFDTILAWLAKEITTTFTSEGLAALNAFATALPPTMTAAVQLFAPSFGTPLVRLANRFSHLLSRACCLLQLAPAVKSTLADQHICGELMTSWHSINFQRMAEHVAASGAVPLDILDQLLTSFSNVLAQLVLPTNDAFFMMLDWLDRCARVLVELEARDVVTKASFIVGLILRDLTLRTDQSFASFHLLGMFAQEYLGLRLLRLALLERDSQPAPAPLSPPMAASPVVSRSMQASPTASVHSAPAAGTRTPVFVKPSRFAAPAPIRIAPLPLAPTTLAFGGPTYVIMSPTQPQFANAPLSPMAYHDPSGALRPNAGDVALGQGQTPTPMAMSFAERPSFDGGEYLSLGD